MLKCYWRLQRVIVPGVKYSQHHYADVLRLQVPLNCVWLDMGCGHQLFPSWMRSDEQEISSRAKELIGIDIDEAGIRKHSGLKGRVLGTLKQLPFRDKEFDVATANMVVEHLDQPEKVLEEISRVLKDGAILIVHTPNRKSIHNALIRCIPQSMKQKLALLLEGREAADVFPTYYRLNTMDDIRSAAEKNAFDVQSVEFISSSAQTAILGPLAIVELLFIRVLEAPIFQERRTNLIAVLRKKCYGSEELTS